MRFLWAFRCNHPPFGGVSNRKPIIVGAHRARWNAPEDGRLSALRPLYTAQTFLSLSPV
ncbi:MAG: hypothetical protein LBK44_04640 [Spirochaetales bacterium]|nr:hypothetical protein [Spirochaetales bacterium]